jgi:hypothetical protein
MRILDPVRGILHRWIAPPTSDAGDGLVAITLRALDMRSVIASAISHARAADFMISIDS